jgi:hypothetical protein
MEKVDIVMRLVFTATNTMDNEVDDVCTAAADEIERLRAVLDAIKAMHQPYETPQSTPIGSMYACRGCAGIWPCSTHRRLLHPEEADQLAEALRERESSHG